VTLAPGRPAALVTGAARRLGRALAEALADDGFLVCVHYNRSRDEALRLVDELAARGQPALAVQADLAVPHQAEGLVPECADQARRAGSSGLTVLVNNASLFELDTLDSFSTESWERHAAINLRAPALLARAFASAVPERVSGLIVNLLDNKVFAPNPDFFSYTVSKLGLLGLTRLLAQALAPGIRVCGIAPGVTLPSGAQSAAGFARAQRLNPLGRGAQPGDVVTALRYLMATPCVTGEVLTLDGGQNLAPAGRDVVFLTEPGPSEEP
jgi:NAD(P)-dependent dehydrogenase (short-subunit alcohol dehydrogenase family)